MSTLFDQVKSALEVIYAPHTGQAQKAAAEEWLRELYAQPAAWQIALDFMAVDHIGSQLWGATVLCEKIRNQWQTLSSEQQTDMQNILRSQLKMYSAAKRIPMITKVCMCLSWVWIHSVAKKSWPNFFSEISALAQNQLLARDGDPTSVINTEWTYFELVKVLAEEVSSCKDVNMGWYRAAIAELREQANPIFSVCYKFLRSECSDAVRDQAVQTVDTWAQLDPRPTEGLFALIGELWKMTASYPHIESLAHVLEAIESCLLVTNVLKFPKALSTAIRQFSDIGTIAQKCFEEDDDDSIQAICSFVRLLADHFSNYLIADPATGLTICRAANELLERLDHSTGNILLEFWTCLENGIDDSVPEPNRSTFQTAVIEGLKMIHSRCRLAADVSAMPKDVYSQLEAFRTNAAEVFTMAYSTVIGESVLQMLAQSLENDLKAISLVQHYTMAMSECMSAEVTLFFLAQITEAIPEDEFKYVPRIVDILCHIPAHLTVQQSALRFIGCLGMWLSANHRQHPEYAQKIASYVVPSIMDESLSMVAGRALSDIAREAPDALAPHLPEILRIMQQTLFKMVPVRRAAIILGLSHIIALLPFEQAQAIYLDIVRSLCANIEATMQQPIESMSEQTIFDLSSELGAISMCCPAIAADTTLDPMPPHPFVASVNFAWPLMEKVGLLLISIPKIASAVDRAIRHFSLVIPREQVRGHLRSMLNFIVQNTKIDPTIPPIKSISIMLAVYQTRPSVEQQPNASSICSNPQDISDMSSALEIVIRTCLETAKVTEGYNPQVLGNLFGLVMAASRRIPESVLGNLPFLQYVLETSLQLLNRAQDKKLHSWLCRLIHSLYTFDDTKWRPYFLPILGQYFKPLVQQLYLAIGGAVPRSHLDEIAGIVLSLLTRYPNEMRAVSMELLAQPGFPSNHVSDKEKLAFLEEQFRYVGQKDRLAELLRTFSGRCRGIGGPQ